MIKEIVWIWLMTNNLMKDIIYKKEKKMIYNQKNQKLMKDIRYKIWNHLKVLIAKKHREWWSCWYWYWAGDKCGGKHRIKYFWFSGRKIDRKSRWKCWYRRRNSFLWIDYSWQLQWLWYFGGRKVNYTQKWWILGQNLKIDMERESTIN